MTIHPDLLQRARALDTAAVSDALDSLSVSGHLRGIQPRVPGATAVGIAYTVAYRPVGRRDEFRNAANYLDDVPAGSIVVIDNHGSTTCTTWGGLLTSLAAQRGIAGTVLHGSARDIAEIRDADYPLFSSGIAMVSGKNRVELHAVEVDITIGDVLVRTGDLIVADDNGVLAVGAEIANDVITRAEAVEHTEARIAAAVAAGSRLDEARRQHGYAHPWAPPVAATP